MAVRPRSAIEPLHPHLPLSEPPHTPHPPHQPHPPHPPHLPHLPHLPRLPRQPCVDGDDPGEATHADDGLRFLLPQAL
jgi:hypothetical protein